MLLVGLLIVDTRDTAKFFIFRCHGYIYKVNFPIMTFVREQKIVEGIIIICANTSDFEPFYIESE